jgi:hypothetical protein
MKKKNLVIIAVDVIAFEFLGVVSSLINLGLIRLKPKN